MREEGYDNQTLKYVDPPAIDDRDGEYRAVNQSAVLEYAHSMYCVGCFGRLEERLPLGRKYFLASVVLELEPNARDIFATDRDSLRKSFHSWV